MRSTVLFRSDALRILGAAVMVFAVLGIGSLAWGQEWDDLAKYGGLVCLVGFLGWAALWVPYVEVSDGGVTLVNVLRTIRLPWPAIREVDGRYGLRLETAYGRFTAWAAPAPRGRSRAAGVHSEAAQLVRVRPGQ